MELAATILDSALLIVFSILYGILLFVARRGLAKLPYYEFRLPKLYMEMHVRKELLCWVTIVIGCCS